MTNTLEPHLTFELQIKWFLIQQVLRCLVLTQLFLCPFPVHRPPEGVEVDQVTNLPSFKALLKELRARNADLLALLHEQGPSTEGIFRLAASERASREIREALDCGAEVHLASQLVHLLAIILKDFLHNIPSKLVHAELYQQWMDALQKTSRQERLAGLKECCYDIARYYEHHKRIYDGPLQIKLHLKVSLGAHFSAFKKIISNQEWHLTNGIVADTRGVMKL
ncbi:hypothetical protein Q9233_000693 [Columba guinea]|nr:hypothetical protein Q9233_000693 [Columba guinea]